MLLEEKQRFSTASRFTTVSTISDLEPDYSRDKGRLEGRAGDGKEPGPGAGCLKKWGRGKIAREKKKEG